MTIELTQSIVRNSQLVFTSMGEEVVMMNIERGEYLGLDAVGSKIMGHDSRTCKGCGYL